MSNFFIADITEFVFLISKKVFKFDIFDILPLIFCLNNNEQTVTIKL